MKYTIFVFALVAVALASPQRNKVDKVKVAEQPDYSVRVVENAQNYGTGQIVDPGFYRPTAGQGQGQGYAPISTGPAYVQNGPNQYPYRPSDGVGRQG